MMACLWTRSKEPARVQDEVKLPLNRDAFDEDTDGTDDNDDDDDDDDEEEDEEQHSV